MPVSRERYAYASSTAAPRPLLQRGLVVLLLVTGVTLLALAKVQHPAAQKLRLHFLEMLNPVLSVVSQPVQATRTTLHSLGDYRHTVQENRALKRENETLRHWQSVALSLKAENESLRRLMDYHPVADTSYVTARIIGSTPGSYQQSFIINAGRDQGVKDLQPVVDSYGLVGRVVEVSATTSRVLLLSDILSRVPVTTGNSRQRAILSGTGGRMLRLGFLTVEQKNIALGEPVLTTEEGGLIPGGIMVGEVFRSDKGGYMVKPVRPLRQPEYVRVIVLD